MAVRTATGPALDSTGDLRLRRRCAVASCDQELSQKEPAVDLESTTERFVTSPFCHSAQTLVLHRHCPLDALLRSLLSTIQRYGGSPLLTRLLGLVLALTFYLPSSSFSNFL